ncbi:MAG TPA: DEAD/DEAH box helicase [archaeon]|nr:DEAD/DEAH box helicase [archaeon]
MGFIKMGLNPKLVEGLKAMKITNPTPIQEKCIPQIKAGKDVVGQSLTGSGKTAAFGLPILEKIIPGGGIQALIIVPTRELCVQVRDNLEQYSRFLPINIISIYGGVGFFQQMEEIKYGEIIVATPGRLLDHMGRRNVSLRNIKFVVLDEADRMFEMGFEDDVDKILRQTPSSRQTIMFSATMPRAAQQLIKKYLKNPINIQEKLQVDKSLLKQIFYSVKKNDKFSLLVHLLKNKTSGPAIVFCGTKREVDKVAKQLRKQKIDSLPVHGDLTQGKRQFAVNSFKSSKIDVLVATDVAARGLDIKDVSHVYNYDVPRTPEEYTHRIGRTARAGKKGDAVTLLSERDFNNFNRILRFGKMNIVQEKLPEFERIESTQEYPHEEYSRDNYSNKNFSSNYQRGYPRRNDSNPITHNKRHNYDSNESRWGKEYSSHKRNQSNSNEYNYNSENYSNSHNNQTNSNYSKQNKHNYLKKQDSSKNLGVKKPMNQKNHSSNHINFNRTQNSNSTHERTPRTPNPLFETSHYHPNYKMNKTDELIKTNAESYFKANKNRLKNNTNSNRHNKKENNRFDKDKSSKRK